MSETPCLISINSTILPFLSSERAFTFALSSLVIFTLVIFIGLSRRISPFNANAFVKSISVAKSRKACFLQQHTFISVISSSSKIYKTQKIFFKRGKEKVLMFFLCILSFSTLLIFGGFYEVLNMQLVNLTSYNALSTVSLSKQTPHL